MTGVPRGKPAAGEAALAELARRHLAAYGPRDRRRPGNLVRPPDWRRTWRSQAPEFTSRIQRGGGWLHPVLAIDGWVVATWRLQRRKGQLDVIVEPFESLDRAALFGLQEEVADVSRFARQLAKLTIAGAVPGGAGRRK